MATNPTKSSFAQKIAFFVALGLTFVVGMGTLWPSGPRAVTVKPGSKSGGCACAEEDETKKEKSKEDKKEAGSAERADSEKEVAKQDNDGNAEGEQ